MIKSCTGPPALMRAISLGRAESVTSSTWIPCPAPTNAYLPEPSMQKATAEPTCGQFPTIERFEGSSAFVTADHESSQVRTIIDNSSVRLIPGSLQNAWTREIEAFSYCM